MSKADGGRVPACLTDWMEKFVQNEFSDTEQDDFSKWLRGLRKEIRSLAIHWPGDKVGAGDVLEFLNYLVVVEYRWPTGLYPNGRLVVIECKRLPGIVASV